MRRAARSGIAIILLAGALLAALAAPRAVEASEDRRCGEAGSLSLCVVPAFPIQGEACAVLVSENGAPAAGARVKVTYRPNSKVSFAEIIGITDEEGRLSWTPRDAGIAALESGLAVITEEDGPTSVGVNVSVRFRRVPALGLWVLILAGIILFGGNGYSFAKTFGAGKAEGGG